MYDLNDVATREALQRQIKADIDQWCVEKYADAARKHLGASVIGHECARYIWYSFRWVYQPTFSGKMYRLFNRGHREEERFVEWLTGIGVLVSDTTADGSQHRIADVEGHFGGSLDSMAKLADRWQITQPIVVGEFKTSNQAGFAKLLKPAGMKAAKPQHFAQFSIYGYKQNIEWSLYMAINKNDDDLHIEFVKNDFLYAQDLLRKAHDIIIADTPPRRIASTPSFHTCSFCDARHVCWQTHTAEKNCRSCMYAQAAPNKEWLCRKFGSNIPGDFIPRGCGQWETLPIHANG